MRLPFISRRRAQASVDFATAGLRVRIENVERELAEERTARFQAERKLAAERKLHRRAVAYIGQAEGRRDVDGYRLARALRAIARLRAEAATQRRVERGLTDQLLDATGFQGEPLLPAARHTLDLDKEDA